MKNPAARNAELQNGVREIMAEPGRVLVRRAGTIGGATAGAQDVTRRDALVRDAQRVRVHVEPRPRTLPPPAANIRLAALG
jgi:hypothetical protein